MAERTCSWNTLRPGSRARRLSHSELLRAANSRRNAACVILETLSPAARACRARSSGRYTLIRAMRIVYTLVVMAAVLPAEPSDDRSASDTACAQVEVHDVLVSLVGPAPAQPGHHQRLHDLLLEGHKAKLLCVGGTASAEVAGSGLLDVPFVLVAPPGRVTHVLDPRQMARLLLFLLLLVLVVLHRLCGLQLLPRRKR